jgi:hypothetical protein
MTDSSLRVHDLKYRDCKKEWVSFPFLAPRLVLPVTSSD